MVERFDGPDELAEWLEERDIDTAVWGTGTFKSIANLWDEYLKDAVSFADPALRIVQVVQVLIQQDGKILCEVEQEFKNGKCRRRNRPPSEKINRNESSIDAAYRCLDEELGIRPEQVSIMATEGQVEELNSSPSYPGLQTRYLIQRFRADVPGLPKEDFWRENTAAEEDDPVSRHLWAWKEQCSSTD